jgi:cyclic pyranopterin phosphate synthase
LTKQLPLDVRFIEIMPVEEIQWQQQNFISRAEILTNLSGLEEVPSPAGNDSGPAGYYRYPNAHGRIGFISSLSQPACTDCNRLRLTAQGVLLRCLYDSQGLDLRSAIRDNHPSDDIKDSIRAFLLNKQDVGVGQIQRDAFDCYSPCLAAVGG